MWPAIVSGSVVQVSVMLNAIFASHVAGDGPVTWLYSAFRLMQLPLGLFGVGLATVSLPSLARLATHGIGDSFRDTLSKAIRMGALLSVPSAVGLAVLAEPIMSVVYGNGAAARNPLHVPGCAAALQTYALGLVFYSGLKVLQPAFYAIEKRFVPLIASVICVLVTAVLNYLFVIRWHLDHRYLALSTSITAALNFALLFLAMRRFAGRLHGRELMRFSGKILVAAACMAAVCWGARLTLLAGWTGYGLPLRILTLGATIAVAAGVYFGVSVLLRNHEVEDIRRRVLRALSRGK
jgi:putative peptidoglycan lipid II flippase